jgi:sulfur relay (sulfurtransferase) complex TusBCD TusD component (DsrE family)
MLLMMCDQCANQRGLATENADGGYTPEGTVEGVAAGCFPDLYQALSGNMPDQVISL